MSYYFEILEFLKGVPRFVEISLLDKNDDVIESFLGVIFLLTVIKSSKQDGYDLI